jgi:hypothetical protein
MTRLAILLLATYIFLVVRPVWGEGGVSVQSIVTGKRPTSYDVERAAPGSYRPGSGVFVGG